MAARFIAVDRAAANEIISDRTLQSADEYQNGRLLAAVLQGGAFTESVGPRLRVFKHGEGLFFLSVLEGSQDAIVFDLDTCGLFAKDRQVSEVLLQFQKVLRFAVKVWGRMKLSVTEAFAINSSKAIIWPYPISQHTSFRIAIETKPDSKRQARRESQGHLLLVYRSGFDEGGGPQEEVSVTTFRRFLEDRKSLGRPDGLVATATPSANITSLSVTTLETPTISQANPFQGYQQWLDLLTDRQKAFVTAALSAPHRIEGPAGTGKTLCLILKAIAGLHSASISGREHRALFITHSEATRRTVEQLFVGNDPWRFLDGEANLQLQSLRLATLQQLCGDLLQRKIAETEFLDRDAMESKQMQLLYVDEALNFAMSREYPTHQKFLSPGFSEFLTQTENWALAEMLRHEISVVIKGRADEQLENYRKLPRLKYGLPTETPADRGFVWSVFKKYQDQLQAAAQFDTDDIVLTTIGQLDTPIWRRRRVKEGYDNIYIDETHLFNINELSIFHHLSRATEQYPIAYSVDRSQAVGDRGWTDQLFEEALSPDPNARVKTERTEIHGIFRCSPDIVNLAFSVTSAGATLFTNFDDPLRIASSMFTPEEERKCAPPVLVTSTSDDGMIRDSFLRAEQLAKDLDVSRSQVALVAFNDDLFKKAEAFASEHNKPVELLKQRGDIQVIQHAEKSGRFVLSAPDYIGGLDFSGVVLIGVDDGRVPPTKTSNSGDSANFLSYASHNQLYVAITRARFRVEVVITKERGISSLLKGAFASGVLTEVSSGKAK